MSAEVKTSDKQKVMQNPMQERIVNVILTASNSNRFHCRITINNVYGLLHKGHIDRLLVSFKEVYVVVYIETELK